LCSQKLTGEQRRLSKLRLIIKVNTTRSHETTS